MPDKKNRHFDAWNLTEWTYYLENSTDKEIQLGLTRIIAVAQKLNLLETKSKVIIVGGTNGKGSTVSALETIYHHAGYTVGAYTSPHLHDFNERVRVNLQPISDSELCRIFTSLEKERDSIALTYFEMTTIAALLYFKTHQVDLIILEVGLGGRLDATNIMNADVSIITTIDLDHQDYLGNTIEAIGYEKSGILREGGFFIYADINPPTSIINAALNKKVHTYYYNNDYSFKKNATPQALHPERSEGSPISQWDFEYLNNKIESKSPLHSIKHIPTPSIQLKSAAVAIMATQILNTVLPITDENIRIGMSKIFIPGRLELVQDTISVVYDVAHNPQAARLLADFIKKMRWEGRIFAVFSALKDKDIPGLLHPLKELVNEWFPAPLDTKRGADANFLLSKFQDAEINQKVCYNGPRAAFNASFNKAQPGDLIIVYGSFYTVSSVRCRGGIDEIGT